MNKPKHQHFIPKSYLKNFSEEINGVKVVEAKLKSDGHVKAKPISIRDICVNKNLYTLTHREGEDKYALENYYAEEIDKVYPEVYQWLINPDLIKITPEQRIKILLTTMSLFFRTPKFLNVNQRRINHILDYAAKHFKDEQGNIKFRFNGADLSFNVKDIEEMRTELKAKNKQAFLQNHIQEWHQFVNFKSKAAICVYRLTDDSELITSDNPVIMRSIDDHDLVNPFDPTNMISLPLDNKHYLSIFPNTEQAMLDTIYRTDRDKWFSLTTNLQVEKSSEDWILGKIGTIKKHLQDQEKYGALTPENFKEVENMKKRAEDGNDLNRFMELFGFPSQPVLDKVRWMMNNKIHQKDPEIIKMVVELAKRGYYL
ncbi:DUF4238 domain-containing protein [Pedobacter sp. UBA5917]|jgi:hypothetical protein|uniref:DUF4238 domain-containing protein n=1 Tax=Pedobacter sp. UBA5917 TaxID=1947061 RepID=UPI0025CDD6AF|nr:DUF4238 domain-containing protein [Pedobacter sp. UBA5917]